MTADQQIIIDFLELQIGGYQASRRTGERYLLCHDRLNNFATYAYRENATAQEIFDHTQRRRKEFGIEINYEAKEMSDVAG